MIESIGIALATVRMSSAFLKVSMPEKEIRNPNSIEASAKGSVSVKQCMTPLTFPRPCSLSISKVSLPASRVWMIRGLWVLLAASICTRKRSRCHSVSPFVRK